MEEKNNNFNINFKDEMDETQKLEWEKESNNRNARWNPEWSEKAKSLTLYEAIEIFEVFKNWYYPCGVLLEQVFFMGGVPCSFLPYPKDIIDSTLTIMKKYFLDMGDQKTFNNTEDVQCSIWFRYQPDEEAWETLAEMVLSGTPNIPREKIIEAKSKCVKGFNEEYIEWLKKVGKFNKL